jgi:hypothetical protein
VLPVGSQIYQRITLTAESTGCWLFPASSMFNFNASWSECACLKTITSLAVQFLKNRINKTSIVLAV